MSILKRPKACLEVRPLFENCEPREACLVDFEGQAFKELCVPSLGEATFMVMVGPVVGMAGRDFAVSSHEVPIPVARGRNAAGVENAFLHVGWVKAPVAFGFGLACCDWLGSAVGRGTQ